MVMSKDTRQRDPFNQLICWIFIAKGCFHHKAGLAIVSAYADRIKMMRFPFLADSQSLKMFEALQEFNNCLLLSGYPCGGGEAGLLSRLVILEVINPSPLEEIKGLFPDISLWESQTRSPPLRSADGVVRAEGSSSGRAVVLLKLLLTGGFFWVPCEF